MSTTFTQSGCEKSVSAAYSNTGLVAYYSHVRDPATQAWRTRFATHEFDRAEPKEVTMIKQGLDLSTVLKQPWVESRTVLERH